MNIWKEPIQFQWDRGNHDKNWFKHRVTAAECEEAFFDPHKRVYPALKKGETRYLLIGQTKERRVLFLVFTIRGHAVRVISARDLNRKENSLYEEAA